MTIMTIIDKINSLKSLIVSEVNKKLNEELNELGELYSYEIVWKQFETAAAEVIKSILESEIPNAVIEIPKSKSKYPDIKIIVDNNKYAIDIKCAEIQKDPWYDMARLDTFVDSRINVYKEEWELLIQYDSEYKKFKKVFFGLFKDFVGYDQRCNGVKYRPYDGKIRPKSWNDIENNVIYWETREKLISGVRNSQIYRWKTNIKEHLVPILTDEEKEEFKSLF